MGSVIGVGPEVSMDHIAELGDIFDGTEFERDVDLWDAKVAANMMDLREITDEVDFGIIIPGEIRITDDAGNVVYHKTDGFPQRLEFKVNENVKSVTLEIAGQVIEQSLQ